MRTAAVLVRLAAVGTTAGLALAARDLGPQRYLSQGLWRTALWLLSRDALLGAALGILAGLLFLAVIRLVDATVSPEPRAAAHRFGCYLALVAALALVGSPLRGGPPGGPPFPLIFVLIYTATWFALSAAGAAAARAGSDPRWFTTRWVSIIGFALAAAILHVWVRAASYAALATGLFLALLTAGLIAVVPNVPARLLHDRLGRPLGRTLSGRPGAALSVLLLVGALALVIVSGIQSTAAKNRTRQRGINVILLGIDTLRYDRADLLGGAYPRDLCPNLHRLAARGTVFSNAFSQAPWTLPSFASILTGLYPEQHGAEHLTSTLPARQLTLAEILRDEGYETMGVVSCEYLNAASGLGQGFDVLDETQVLGHRAITSAAITDRALQLLEAREDQPFFLFLHYFDPHFCYQDHRDYCFADTYDGRLREAVQSADQNAFRWLIYALGPAFASRSRVSEADRQFLRDTYDEEVAYTDSQLGRLFDYLDANDLWKSTLVILVSDHGEELLERNWSGHTVTLYQEDIHVPLVLVKPAQAAGRVDPLPVEARAVFPTILDFLGVARPMLPTPPSSLFADRPALDARLVRSSTRPVAEPPAPGEFIPKYVWLTCVIDGRWKLIKDHLQNRSQLIDLEADPHEMENQSANHPRERQQLGRELDRLNAKVGRGPAASVPQASEEQKRKLESLGYL